MSEKSCDLVQGDIISKWLYRIALRALDQTEKVQALKENQLIFTITWFLVLGFVFSLTLCCYLRLLLSPFATTINWCCCFFFRDPLRICRRKHDFGPIFWKKNFFLGLWSRTNDVNGIRRTLQCWLIRRAIPTSLSIYISITPYPGALICFLAGREFRSKTTQIIN